MSRFYDMGTEEWKFEIKSEQIRESAFFGHAIDVYFLILKWKRFACHVPTLSFLYWSCPYDIDTSS